jgi:hypothetical protein
MTIAATTHHEGGGGGQDQWATLRPAYHVFIPQATI